MLGLRGKPGRPELIEKYGFDTKFAMHMVRLGVQGVELLETGRITLPVPEPWLSWLRELRQGKKTREEALEAAESLERRLDELVRVASPLPAEPDTGWVDDWLVRTYLRAWKMP
ncbi:MULTISPECIES: nucleotidyltransferase domain-containing protein [unclassified Amycolatopsis]|uniref:nucleotidyltransferase domain-containing protein n=1 Tax=unclassified Amycolatopsis TaxID=2618356 RepID=UPI002105BDF6|nr:MULTISPECIES: nucleotidyltransferase domain-containing protein [unclassified Amycolatopsis]